jgi:hypothetical protein
VHSSIFRRIVASTYKKTTVLETWIRPKSPAVYPLSDGHRSFANFTFALIRDAIAIGGTRITEQAETRAVQTTVAATLSVA